MEISRESGFHRRWCTHSPHSHHIFSVYSFGWVFLANAASIQSTAHLTRTHTHRPRLPTIIFTPSSCFGKIFGVNFCVIPIHDIRSATIVAPRARLQLSSVNLILLLASYTWLHGRCDEAEPMYTSDTISHCNTILHNSVRRSTKS